MDGLFTSDMLPVSSIPPSKARKRASTRRKAPMDHSTEWPLEGSINVVLFAGMGGACQGLEDAGFPVHVAVNHDEVAIAAHKALNPHTHHMQADIYEVCPLDATNNRNVNILWMSPDCRDHSVAKGGAPRSPRVRSMPWQGCRWVGVLRKHGRGPNVIYLENVREIRGWGPLIAKRDKTSGRVLKVDGTVAEPGERVPVQQQQLVRDPKRVGRTYRAWVKHMQMLGVRYEDRDLNCADYGIPTSRKRLFGVGVFNDCPIQWPDRTHAGRKDLERLNAGRSAQGLSPLLPHRAAAEIIDWSLRLPSIFDRSKDLAAATQKRIAVGMRRFVIDAAKPFLIHLTHGGRLHDIGSAAPTVTTAHRGEIALVGPALIPTTHSKSPARAHDGAGATPTLTAAVKGGEFAVMGATIVGAGGRAAQVPPMNVADALNTSTTKEDRCLVAATLVGVAHGDDARSGSRTYDLEDALRTATGSNDQAVIAAHLTRYHGERRPGEARGADPVDSLPTSTTENRFGIVGATLAPHITKFRNNSVGHELDEALHTVTCSHSTYHPGAAPPLGVVAATLAPSIMANNANNIGAAGDDAVPTVTTGNRNFVVGAHLTKFQENSVGQSPDAPIDTVMAGATRFGVVGAFLEEAHGNSAGRDVAAPMPTQTQTPHHSVIGATLVQTGYGEREGQAPRALDVEDAIGTQVASSEKHAVVGAWMVQHNNHTKPNGESDVHSGHSITDSISTMTTTVSHQQVAGAFLVHQRGTGVPQDVEAALSAQTSGGDRGGSHHQVTGAFLSEYYSTGGQHQPVDAPLNTLPTVDRFAVHGAGMTVPPLPPEKLARARQVAAFLRAHGVWDDREFVTVGPWIVVDIGMRMLLPREAAAAHELRMPDQITIRQRDRKGNLVIDEEGNVLWVTRQLTKTESMRLVGNSVPKRMAMLLAQANAVHALHAPSRHLQAAE